LNSGSAIRPAWQYGKPKCIPARGARSSSSGGNSLPSSSRPLSVNHSSWVTGCQAKPTELRTPLANTSSPVPSGCIRAMVPKIGSSRRQMLHGAPIGM
jgi:hypothetical protein